LGKRRRQAVHHCSCHTCMHNSRKEARTSFKAARTGPLNWAIGVSLAACLPTVDRCCSSVKRRPALLPAADPQTWLLESATPAASARLSLSPPPPPPLADDGRRSPFAASPKGEGTAVGLLPAPAPPPSTDSRPSAALPPVARRLRPRADVDSLGVLPPFPTVEVEGGRDVRLRRLVESGTGEAAGLAAGADAVAVLPSSKRANWAMMAAILRSSRDMGTPPGRGDDSALLR